MPCKLCEEKNKTGNSKGTVCAFINGTFSPDNHDCATITTLQDIARRCGLLVHNRNTGCTLGAVPLPPKKYNRGYIMLIWYDNQNRADIAGIMAGNDIAPKPLTVRIALAAINYNQGVANNATRGKQTSSTTWEEENLPFPQTAPKPISINIPQEG
jgi:hypothetical protein